MSKKLVLILIITIGLASCDFEEDSLQRDRSATNQILKDYTQTQPIPKTDWSRTRQTVIEILNNKINANATYTVERATGSGQILRVFASIGYPVPADTQLTNPTQITCRYEHSGECATVEQAEPDGTYTSKNTDGTYALEVLPNGTQVLYYSEQKLSAFAYPIRQIDDFRVERVGDVPESAKLKPQSRSVPSPNKSQSQ